MRNATVATCSLILLMVIIAGIFWNIAAGYLDRLEDKEIEQIEEIEAYTPAGLGLDELNIENSEILEVLTW